MGRQPSDKPIGMNSSVGVWLAPGFHLIHVQYVRNIEAGISFTQGDVPIRLSAGHTYMIHPVITTDSGKVSFFVIDYGVSFPVACLPGSISEARKPDPSGKRARFTREDILACRKQMPR